jgi:hypothetical protein
VPLRRRKRSLALALGHHQHSGGGSPSSSPRRGRKPSWRRDAAYLSRPCARPAGFDGGARPCSPAVRDFSVAHAGLRAFPAGVALVAGSSRDDRPLSGGSVRRAVGRGHPARRERATVRGCCCLRKNREAHAAGEAAGAPAGVPGLAGAVARAARAGGIHACLHGRRVGRRPRPCGRRRTHEVVGGRSLFASPEGTAPVPGASSVPCLKPTSATGGGRQPTPSPVVRPGGLSGGGAGPGAG